MHDQSPPSFGVSGWPGRLSAAGVQQVAEGRYALAIYLDPIMLVLRTPPFPDGPRVMAQFCRELSRAAATLASELDPDGDPASAPNGGPRHAMTVRKATGEGNPSR